MAIRVSRQRIEALIVENPEIRTSRQRVDALIVEDGTIYVSRQRIEVLFPGTQIHEKSASSSISLGQSGAPEATLNRLLTSELVLTQTTENSIKGLSAFSILTMVQTTAFPGIHLADASSIINLTDSAVNSGLITLSASSVLEFIQYADEETKARDVTSILSITDTASVGKILQGFSTIELEQSARSARELLATSELTLTQLGRQSVLKLYGTSQIEFAQTVETDPKYLNASSSLDLSDSNVVLKPIRVSATSELTTYESVWDPDESAVVLVLTGLRDEASGIADLSHTASSVIPIQGAASAHVALATGTSLSASNTIVFTQKAIPEAIEESVTSTLVFSQVASGNAAKPGTSTLEITQAGSLTIDRVLSTISTLELQQSITYTLIIGTTKCQYSPFVGDASTPDLPTPPSAEIDGPMVGIQVPFQLVYPSTGPVSDSVALKTPNLGNKDRLGFQRVIREARGGTLIVYADPIWPKTETLVLTFSGLLKVEAYELLAFIDDHLGLEVGLIDWEHRFWRGVIVKPDEPIIEDKFDSFTVNFEFQGELDSAWNPQVVPPNLRYSATRSSQQDGYYVPIEPQIPVTPEILDYYDAEADSTIIIGNPLYLTAAGHVITAQANSSVTAQVAGLSITDTSIGETCQFLSEGRIERSDWTSVAGVTNLSAGVFYYLDPAVAGHITSTAPTSAGQYVVRLGRAIDTTTLDIEIELPILL